MKKDRAIVMRVSNLTACQAARIVDKSMSTSKKYAPGSRFLGAMQDDSKRMIERRG
jgi:hypothetical protein